VASFLAKFKSNGSKVETPFTIRHGESHLVFGPLSRHLSVAYLMAGAGVLKLVADFRNPYVPAGHAQSPTAPSKSYALRGYDSSSSFKRRMRRHSRRLTRLSAHFIFALHDSVFECVAEDFAVEIHCGSIRSLVPRMTALLSRA
jgi:hypothetical protein